MIAREIVYYKVMFFLGNSGSRNLGEYEYFEGPETDTTP